jgi:cob(I)alamin adenosyltransferase
MKIYTKTGDSGKTGLFGGARVDKNNARIEAYGTIDELNSLIGVILSSEINEKNRTILNRVQQTLFTVGSELATPSDVKSDIIQALKHDEIKYLENCIDEIDDKLEPLKNFILPGGSKSAALLHFARTICRRAERKIITVNTTDNVNAEILIYINRLSDLLFILARFENYSNSTTEIEWKPRG